ncbi:MAG: serine/threonine-protein kinase [Pirellulales bacterium]
MSDRELFVAALQKEDPAERSAYLVEICGADAELRRRVEVLLQAYDDAGSLLKRPAATGEATGRYDVEPPRAESPAGDAVDPTRDQAPSLEAAGTQIGPYRLLQKIGEGGMGTIWMGEQVEPVRRKVAIKVIKPGMDSAQVLARFKAERQALALMDHPNIARVLDAGATQSGRPYFVMELVKGVPITQYCDNHQLSPRQRLELFVPVCQAIQHAHQKGVIHRDIKPSNVLVAAYDGRPVPKVIDFGVVKAVGQPLTERTLFTGFGGIVGTLEYMSPEQAEFNALDIDTRSDVYSLGVLLYELLTGTTPLAGRRLKQAAITEALRVIREEEPPRPSARLSQSKDTLASISAQRKMDPGRLTRLVRGELDWIVMKALEKDRSRRYETANGLARDVERYLSEEPVEACPPSAAYRLRSFAHRHRKGLVTAATFALLLLIGAVASTWQAVRATQAEHAATTQRDAARRARDAEADARREATRERDKALAAEERAKSDRAEAVAAREQVQDALYRSLYDQARAVRLAEQPGRRWTILDLIRRAEQIRGRNNAASLPIEAGATPTSGADRPPTRTQLRSEAVAALLLHDGRVAQQFGGMAHAVSPDGRFAISQRVDMTRGGATLQLVDLTTFEEVASWKDEVAQSLFGTALALGPEGKLLASVTTNAGTATPLPLSLRNVAVAELPSGRRLHLLTLPESAGQSDKTFSMLRTVHFSPDGRYLAGVVFSPPSARVVVWDLHATPPTHQSLASLAQLATPTVAFSPDSRWMALPAGHRHVTLWNLAEARAEAEIELASPAAGSLTFAPRSDQLIIQCAQQAGPGQVSSGLVFWDLNERREVRRIDSGQWLSISPLAVDPGGRWLALGEVAGGIRLFDLREQMPPIRLDHGALVQLVSWSHDGRRLISGGLDSLKLWEFGESTPTTMERLQIQTGDVSGALAFSHDRRWIALDSTQPPQVILLDRATGSSAATFKHEDRGSPFRLLFSPNSRMVLRLGRRGMAAWDVEPSEPPAGTAPKLSTDKAAWSAGFMPDGAVIVGGADVPNARPMAWDAATGRAVWTGEPQPGTMAAVSPDGRWVMAVASISTSTERTTPLVDLSSGRAVLQLRRWAGEGMSSSMAEFSPDGRWLALFELAGMAGPARTGDTLLSAVRENEEWIATIHEVASGREQTTVSGLSGLERFAFSHDGRYLAVGQRGGTLRLWDVTSGEELFAWQAWPIDPDEGNIARNRLWAFTADRASLAVFDSQESRLRFLDLEHLRRELAAIDLGW